MSFRSEKKPYPVISNGDMSGSLTSAVTVIQKMTMMSYSYSWSGSSPVGTVSVQVSNDYELNPDGTLKNAGTWNTIFFLDSSGTVVTSFAVSGNTGNGGVDVDQTGFYAIRTVYTRASGSGTLQALFCGKVA